MAYFSVLQNGKIQSSCISSNGLDRTWRLPNNGSEMERHREYHTKNRFMIELCKPPPLERPWPTACYAAKHTCIEAMIATAQAPTQPNHFFRKRVQAPAKEGGFLLLLKPALSLP
jgi:hypothetical protein